MSKLVWSSEIPSGTGTYWVTYELGLGINKSWVREICEIQKSYSGQFRVVKTQSVMKFQRIEDFFDGLKSNVMWAGPIEEPVYETKTGNLLDFERTDIKPISLKVDLSDETIKKLSHGIAYEMNNFYVPRDI